MNSGNYTPPDYRGAFLRGAGTNPTKSGYAGATVGSFQTHATQTHNHSITDPGHTHGIIINQSIFSSSIFDTQGGAGIRLAAVGTQQTVGAFTGITINNSTTYVDSNETRPYNYGVNWIIKL